MDFEDIIWIGFLLLASLGGAAVKMVGKAFKVEDLEESPQPISHPEWEMEAADFGEEEEPQAEVSPYFTYEDPQVEVKVSAPQETPAPEPVLAETAFDLRRAVIYQTILQNNYSGIE